MRAFLTASLAAATIGLFTASLAAAPANPTAKPNYTPLTHLAQYGYDSGYGGHHCPYGQHYSCWYDDYHHRHCGCH